MHVHLLHIPKTGGITLHRALQAAGVEITRSHNPSDAEPWITSGLVIMLLRDPLARIWSAYCYTKRKGMFEGTLRDFILADHDPWWWGACNVQARMFRPGVLWCMTHDLDRMVRHVCMITGKPYPEGYEYHGKNTGPEYTLAELALLQGAVRGDRFVYNIGYGKDRQ